ncbi:MAG: 5-dehydro-2-deoxygluconokinase [Anaerolineales bacterium]|nr:5-dehydro-2-deoxygluconokinase [Anaerolineales bacterium]
MKPDYVSFSNVIIDDIVFSDGRTMMNTLGGAGTHALAGMRVWSDRIGYVVTVGPDFKPAHRAQLETLGADLRGVVEREGFRTPRAWQLFEPDERRIEVFRTDMADFYQYGPRFEDMPADYLQARGFYLIWISTLPEVIEFIHRLREINPEVRLVWEPTPEHLDGNPKKIQEVLHQIDLCSPAWDEAQAMTEQESVEDAVKTLLAWGAPLVAIRMGAEGSLVYSVTGEGWRIPAVPPSQRIDVTGAGNAYCGGFLVGLGEGLDPVEAALRAAVSASFALEQFGIPNFGEEVAEEAQRRLVWARARTLSTSLLHHS